MKRLYFTVFILIASASVGTCSSVASRDAENFIPYKDSQTAGVLFQGETSNSIMSDDEQDPSTPHIPVDRHADVQEIVPAALWPVYVLYTNFLNIVQLKYFTYLSTELNLTSFDDFGPSFAEGWPHWLLYFIGFAICVFVGLIMTIGMCLGGVIFPCCRCCGKGGKQKDKDGAEHSSCCFKTCCCCCGCLKCCPARNRLTGRLVLMLIVDAILIIGILCVLYTNELLYGQLTGDQTVFDNIVTGASGIEPYLDSAVRDINISILQNYSTSSDEVFVGLYALPQEVALQLEHYTGVLTAVGILSNFSAGMPNLVIALETVTNNSMVLQGEAAALNTSIATVKVDILGNLALCPNNPECWEAGNLTEQLAMDADYSQIDVESAKVIIQDAIDAGFSQIVNYIVGNVSQVMESVKASTLEPIQEAETTSNQLEGDMADAITQLEDAVQNVNSSQINATMSNVQETIDEFGIAEIVYWVIVGLAQVLILVVGTNIVGLMYRWCPRPKVGDSCLKCSRSQGASWLLASTAFTFIGYWICIFVVMLTFAVGGLTYTELCRNVVYYNNSEQQAVLDVFDELISNTLEFNSTAGFFDSYVTCETNASIYTALKMAENGFNITELLDIAYVQEAIDNLKATNLTIPIINLYQSSLDVIFSQLDVAAGLEYGNMKTELMKPVTTVNMTELANLLQSTPYAGTLNDSIAELQKLDQDASAMKMLAQATVPYLDEIMNIFPIESFIDIGAVLNSTEDFVNMYGSRFASGVVNETADILMQKITVLMNGMIYSVQYDIGRCRPLYDSLTMVVDSVCVQALCPLNSFWFSLGWCVFFLLPLLTMSFTMVNVYRMKISREEAKARKKEKKQRQEAQKEDKRLRQEEERQRKQEMEQSRRNGVDEVKFDNLGFENDPLEEYRKEVNERGNNIVEAGQANTKIDAFDARNDGNTAILPMATQGAPFRGANTGLLDMEVPPPDYDDIMGETSALAQLY